MIIFITIYCINIDMKVPGTPSTAIAQNFYFQLSVSQEEYSYSTRRLRTLDWK